MQVLAAAQHHRRMLLQRGVAAWQQYAATRAVKAAAKQHAEQHRSSKLAAAALAGWAARVEAGRVKRQRLFAAAMHRRLWLLRRACRAWRYAAVCSISYPLHALKHNPIVVVVLLCICKHLWWLFDLASGSCLLLGGPLAVTHRLWLLEVRRCLQQILRPLLRAAQRTSRSAAYISLVSCVFVRLKRQLHIA
jgi:hypothetical protein